MGWISNLSQFLQLSLGILFNLKDVKFALILHNELWYAFTFDDGDLSLLSFFLALYFNDYLLNGITRLHCVKPPKVVNKEEKNSLFLENS